MSEYCCFILVHVGIAAALRVLDRIAASERLVVEFATSTHHEAALRWLAKFPDQRVSYTDAVSFALMSATRCTAALGFDHDFELAGFKLWRPQSA